MMIDDCFTIKKGIRMNYIVMDLEFNWPYGNDLSERNGVRLRDEIIEIGAVKLDESLRINGTFSEFVSPTAYCTVNRKVRKLTGISTKMLWYRNSFPVTMQRFITWCGKDCSYVTWSNRDIKVLKDNMAYHGLRTEGLPMCFDIQRMYDDQVSRIGKAIALGKAIVALDINIRGRQLHDALSDAIGTAEVLRRLDLEVNIEQYAV